jgi:hypothetical protein
VNCSNSKKNNLQGNRMTREGDSHPDRDAQFAYIYAPYTPYALAGLTGTGRRVIYLDSTQNNTNPWIQPLP